MVAQLIRLTHK